MTGPDPSDTDLHHVMRLERVLQTPEVRRDRAALLRLLAPDFIEIGASGRRWDRDSILGMLSVEANADQPLAIEVHGLEGRVVSEDVIQMLAESRTALRAARRTSLWCRRTEGWQQVYHQGTPRP